MKRTLFLFCGGPAIYGEDLPKPLMPVRPGESLLRVYLRFLETQQGRKLTKVTLLCDDNQEALFRSELENFDFLVPISIMSCGTNVNTLGKFEVAISTVIDPSLISVFSYPDIFFFGERIEPSEDDLKRNSGVFITAAPLTSRFPSLIIDSYNNIVKGISNYNSPVPANPHFVFGGELWGRTEAFVSLFRDFKLQVDMPNPSLEYDFFFWLINQKKMGCTILHGHRIWVDSSRDVQNLLARLSKPL